jgi:hypothetical protein
MFFSPDKLIFLLFVSELNRIGQSKTKYFVQTLTVFL